jgi:hypothetical protein
MKRKHFLVTFIFSLLYSNLTVQAGASPVSVCNEATLRAALAAGGEIDFGCDGTIVLSSTLTITTNTVLDGLGHNVVVSGGDAVRVFRLATNVDFTIRSLTIANGNVTGTNGILAESAMGAGILNEGGHLILMNCSMLSNVCVGGTGFQSDQGRRGSGDGFGAAVYNNGGSLMISNCVLAANFCRGGQGSGSAKSPFNGFEGAGGIAGGAAICAKDSIVTITSSEIRSNSVEGGPPASGLVSFHIGGPGSGGGLFLDGGTVSISQSLFSNNNAVGGAAVTSLTRDSSSPTGAGQGGAAFITNSRVFISRCRFVTNGAAAGVDNGRNTLSGLTQGGAIFNGGKLDLADTLFGGNVSAGGYDTSRGGEADGGALYSVTSLALDSATFAGNRTLGGRGAVNISGYHDGGAAKGGAVFNRGDLSVTNSTFYSNQALGGEAPSGSNQIYSGDALGGGIFNQGDAVLVNVTVAENNVESPGTGAISHPQPGLVAGGGIFTTNGSTIAQNTIVANNLSGGNCFGALVDNGNNLSSDSSCQFTASGSFNNTDPMLGSLDDYGGPTPTVALLEGSPAIDHGLAIYCPATDQRGVARPAGSGCDIGAFEFTTSSYPENALTIETYSNHVLHVLFTGIKGKAYQVQTATNFTNWTDLSTNTVGTNGTFDFFFTNTLSEQTRFFRTKTP